MDACISMWYALFILTSLETALDAADVKAFQKSEKLVGGFPCEQPQMRSFKVANLLEGQLLSYAKVVPHSTVLHRCDAGTGCCADSQKECKVANATDVELTFWVTSFIDNTKELKVFTFTNHTLCSCQLSVNDIK